MSSVGIDEAAARSPSAAGDAPPLTGGCLCAAVRYRIEGPLGAVVLCHCAQCRRAQGAAFAANAPVAAAHFTLVQGDEALVHYASSPGKWRAFCGRCGSPIHSRRDDKPQWLRLRIGTLDEQPASLRPTAHIHVASKAPWWALADDGLPRHDGIEPGRG